jgi:nifR3 family TIM-barrel protein
MAEAASMLCGAFPELDAIDINMGCPMPKVTKNGEGAALMLDARRAAAIVRAVVGAISKPVSVKIRKGWDESNANASEFAKALEGAGASMVCVHGRTRDQMYSGRADWNAIAGVKRAVAIPVVGNGDICTPVDARRMLELTGCDTVMVGRGALGNPWLLRMIANDAMEPAHEPSQAPAFSERKAVMRRHLELAVALKGERTGVLEMRKHLAWYVKGMRNASYMKNAIFKATDADSLERCIDALGE